MWAALMFLFPLIGAVCYVHSSRLAIISQIRIRAQLTSLVYRKALALSSRFVTKCMQCTACNRMRPALLTSRVLCNAAASYRQCSFRLGACSMCNVLQTVVVHSGSVQHGQSGGSPLDMCSAAWMSASRVPCRLCLCKPCLWLAI